MNTYWAFVSTGIGSVIKVTVQAPNQYHAQQQLRAQYGSQLVSEAALHINPIVDEYSSL